MFKSRYIDEEQKKLQEVMNNPALMVYMSMSTQNSEKQQTIQSIKNQINTKLLKLSQEKFGEFNKSSMAQDEVEQNEFSNTDIMVYSQSHQDFNESDQDIEYSDMDIEYQTSSEHDL